MHFSNDTISKLEFSIYAAASIIELLKRQRDAVGLSLFNAKLELHTQGNDAPICRLKPRIKRLQGTIP